MVSHLVPCCRDDGIGHTDDEDEQEVEESKPQAKKQVTRSLSYSCYPATLCETCSCSLCCGLMDLDARRICEVSKQQLYEVQSVACYLSRSGSGSESKE